MGGASSEHEISLISGQNVLDYLDRKKYRVKSIVISKKGEWSVLDRKATVDKALKGIDVVFNALHGEYGEDGRIQGLLDCFGVKYTGSGVLASALGMDKIKSYELFKLNGLEVPRGVVLKKGDESVDMPSKKVVVKPSCLGSSVGISIIDDKKDLKKAIDKAFEPPHQNKFGTGQGCDSVIIEEYIRGREMTCGVLENVKGQKIFALPVTEIIPPPGRFFDYEVKYDGSTQEITPAKIDKNLTKKIQEIAKRAYEILGCRGYSRTDFIIQGNRVYPAPFVGKHKKLKASDLERCRVYILEVNTLPGLTKESLLPKAARAAGIEFSELLDIIIKNALI